MTEFPYQFVLSKEEHKQFTPFLDLLRHHIGDNFNLSTGTSTVFPFVVIKTDSPHVTIFMLLLRLGLDV